MKTNKIIIAVHIEKSRFESPVAPEIITLFLKDPTKSEK